MELNYQSLKNGNINIMAILTVSNSHLFILYMFFILKLLSHDIDIYFLIAR